MISIDNNFLEYVCGFNSSDKDFSFRLNLKELSVIGCSNVMSGDEECLFLLLVDENKKFFPINFSRLDILYREKIKQYFSLRYNLQIERQEQELELNKAIILFPQKHFGKVFFEKNVLHGLKRVFALSHESFLGILSKEIIHIQS